MRIFEVVVVKIDKFLFPIDFVVIKIDKCEDVPLIVGKHFLATSQAKINVPKVNIKFKIGKEKVIFHISKPTSSSKVRRVYHIEAKDGKLVDKGNSNKGQQVKIFFNSCFGY